MSLITPFVRDNTFIPRVSLTARTVTVNNTSGSIFENEIDTTTPYTYGSFTLTMCTYQPTRGQDLKVLDEGLRDRESYTLFTETPITSVIEGSGRLADQVQIDGVNGVDWFSVVKVKKWNNGVNPHYEAIVVKLPE